MVNRWLQQWVTACNWILVALILLAAMLRVLRAPLVAGAIAIAIAVAVAGVRIRYLRPSAYEAAQQLDIESRQNDRIATAVYYWSAADPSPMLLRQREDTVVRVAKLDPESYFPIRMPAQMQWTAGLAVIFGVLCAFHASYGPPLPALKAKLTESRAIEAVLAPFSRILESAQSEQGKTSPSSVTEASMRDSPESGKLPGLQTSLDSMQNGLSGMSNIQPQDAEGVAKGILSSSSQNREVLQSGHSTSSAPDTGVQIQSGSDHSSQNRADQDGNPTASGNKLAALASRALQALQSLMDDGTGRQSGKSSASNANALSTSEQQQAKSDGASHGVRGEPQSSGAEGHPSQGPPPRDGDGIDISSTSDHRQLSGAGSATQAWQPQANHDKLSLANMTPEHVPLESNGFVGPPGTDRANVAGGTAQVPLENIAPPAVATVNGAGQDTVPTRYRQYVRDYFKLGKN